MPVTSKTECINPRSKRSINIDKNVYDLLSKEIKKALKGGKQLTWTELLNEVKTSLDAKKHVFEGSVDWYTITVKNDLEARGVLKTLSIGGQKRNQLSN
jgi:hypothetical protein